MNKLNKILLIIFLLISSIIFFNKNKVIILLGGYTNKEIKTDTISSKIYKKGRTIDSLDIFNKYVKRKGINLYPKPIIEYIHDTIRTKDTVYIQKDSIKHSKFKVKDSILNGTIFIKSYFNGDIKNAYFNYKLNYSNYFIRVDTIIKTNTIIKNNILSNKTNKYGIGGGYNTLQYLNLSGSFTNKNNWQYIINYGRFTPVNKNIGVNLPSNYLGFNIIKHF